jgi:hypothetical protein
MKRTKPDPDLAKWCAALAEPSVPAEPVPAGWFTVAHLAAEMRLDISTVSERLRRRITAGQAESKRFRILTGRGVYPVPHYRLLK